MNEERSIQAQRIILLEDAKAKLRAFLATIWNDDYFKRVEKSVEQIIEKIDDLEMM
jgi:hypothetical protein